MRRRLAFVSGLLTVVVAIALTIGPLALPSSPAPGLVEHDGPAHVAADDSPSVPKPVGVTVPPPAALVALSPEDEARRQARSQEAAAALAVAEADSKSIASRIVSVANARDLALAEAEALVARRTQTAATLAAAGEELRRHAVAVYARGSASELAALIRATPDRANGLRRTMSDVVLRYDFAELESLREGDIKAAAALSLALEAVERLNTEIEEGQRRLAVAVEMEAAAKVRAEVLNTTVARAAGDFHFPIAGPYTFRNDWHEPRSGGRVHLGNDLFAALGTPLVAVERGVIANLGWDNLGGHGLWLVGQSGTQYYYAHMNSYEPGIANGVVVEAGQRLGQVGDSGNAKGGAAHCHFQVHPGGGNPVNPYPLLAAVAAQDPNNQSPKG